MTLALFAQTGLVAHVVSVLAPALGRQGAGLAAGASGVAAVVGRVAVGWRASGTSNWRAIASYSLVAQALGCGVLLLADGSSPAVLVVGVVLFGLGVGNAISVPPVIANLEFSKEDAARIVALIVAISQGAYAIAPAVFGQFRELLVRPDHFRRVGRDSGRCDCRLPLRRRARLTARYSLRFGWTSKITENILLDPFAWSFNRGQTPPSRRSATPWSGRTVPYSNADRIV